MDKIIDPPTAKVHYIGDLIVIKGIEISQENRLTLPFGKLVERMHQSLFFLKHHLFSDQNKFISMRYLHIVFSR